MRTLTMLIIALFFCRPAVAQFSDSGQENSEYDRTDGRLSTWATHVISLDRGYQDYLQPELGPASLGSPGDCLGSAGTAVSLGDGGAITLGFDVEITNGAGDDLVVFENGFEWNGVFMELGYVEVSSNGVDFSRLPALCRRTTQPGPWDTSEPDLFYNLAGNFVGGTGFDLQDLITAADPNVAGGAVDPDHIIFIRIVDVIGDLANGGANWDHLGRAVADPYPTVSESCGMDLTGVAVINTGVVAVEETSWGAVKSLYR